MAKTRKRVKRDVGRPKKRLPPVKSKEPEDSPIKGVHSETKPFVHTAPPHANPTRSVSPLPPIDPSWDISVESYQDALVNTPELFSPDEIRDNPIVKKIVLTEVEAIPEMWSGHSSQIQSRGYCTVGCNVYRRTGKLVTPAKIAAYLKQSKDALRSRVRDSIVKFHHSPSETEAHLWKWPMYKYIRFYRASMDESELKLRQKCSDRAVLLEGADIDSFMNEVLEDYSGRESAEITTEHAPFSNNAVYSQSNASALRNDQISDVYGETNHIDKKFSAVVRPRQVQFEEPVEHQEEHFENVLHSETKPFVHIPPPYAAPLRSVSPLPPIDPSWDISVESYQDALANTPELFSPDEIRDNPIVKKIALAEIEDIPEMWSGKSTNKQGMYYNIVGCNIYRRTGKLVTPAKVVAFFKQIKDSLRIKIGDSIIKLHHSPSETEAHLWKWPMYKYIRFFRPKTQLAEKRFRQRVASHPVYVNDDEELDEFMKDTQYEDLNDDVIEDNTGRDFPEQMEESRPVFRMPQPTEESSILVKPLTRPANTSSSSSASSPAQVSSQSRTEPAPEVAQPPTQNDDEIMQDLQHLVHQAKRAARGMSEDQVKILRAALFDVVFTMDLNTFDTVGDLYQTLAEKNQNRRRQNP